MDEYQRKILTEANFVADELTETQVYAILEPMEAPENYACDGECTPAESKKRWLISLKRSGLSEINIMRARKLNGI